MIIWFVMILFTLATVGILMAEINENQTTRYFTKPLLMPLLAVFYVMNAFEVSWLIMAALVFSFAGDVFLLWAEKKLVFLAGLVAFLLAQLMYCIFVAGGIDFTAVPSDLMFGGIAGYIALGGAIYGTLFRHLGKMKIPVLVYVLILVLMSFLTFIRMGQHEGVAGWMPFAGSLFFIVSDTILAFHTFKAKINNGGVYTMATYLFAQIMLICGFILS